METQKNRGSKDQDLKKDSLSHSKQQDVSSQKRTPEASTKKSSEEKSENLREDRSQIEKDSARKQPAADKQPRK